MSYSVDLELDILRCHSRADADQAAAVINTDPWMKCHLRASPTCRSSPQRDDAWGVALDEFDGCSWNEPCARRVWLALAPFMANDSILEFRLEDATRFRIRWEAGRVFEDFPKRIEWAVECEITAELLAE